MENKEIFEKALMKKACYHKDSELLKNIADEFSVRHDVILSVFEFYQDKEEIEWEREDCQNLFFEKIPEGIMLWFELYEFPLSEEEFFSFLGLVSDVFLPVLPLGSCVRLKGDAAEAMGFQDGEAPEVVIVDRYTAIPEAGIYFPYSGAPYPLGTFGTERKIHFGPQLIEEVLYTGFVDEKEDAFLALMKEEYILERGLHSMAFANKEEEGILRGLTEKAGKTD